jgi:hypothetical protein
MTQDYRTLANTDEEWQQMLAGDAPGVARSRQDWDRMLADDSKRSGLFPNCDAATIDAFTNGLVFNERGLVTADFSMVADKLTYNEWVGIWNEFGAGESLAGDWAGYKCSSPTSHTCVVASNCICTSNC